MATEADAARASDEQLLPGETESDARARPRTFYGAPACTRLDDLNAQVAFIGVPYDLGSRYGGTREGPDAVRDEDGVYLGWAEDGEQLLPTGYFDAAADKQQLDGVTIADCGDVVIVASDVERNFWRITRSARAIVERGSLLFAVGGDHSITPALVRGLDSFEALDFVQFDAHHDFVDDWEGIRWSNKSAVRRTAEFPWVRNISQIGLRTARVRGPMDDLRARATSIVTSDHLREIGPAEAIGLVPESDAMYVTIDVDVLDPSVCPGTGATEPGGLSYVELRTALRALARRGRIVGVDLVELNPKRDPSGVSVKTASRLIVDVLTAIFENE
jgi:agmatinase